MRLIFLVFFSIVLSGCASQLMLYPSIGQKIETINPTPELKVSSPSETVVVTNSAGHKISGLLIEPQNSRGTVIVSGGNAMLRRQTAHYYRFLIEQKFRVLFFSFQGFDENEGQADLNLMLSDASAFIDYLANKYPGQKIAYVGDSISSAVALCLPGYGKKLSAIAVEGAVDPSAIVFYKLKQLWYLFPLYPILVPTAIAINASVPNDLNVRSCLGEFTEIPLLFIHHPNDIVTPFSTAYEIFDSYSGSKEFLVPKAGEAGQNHLNLWRDDKLRSELIHFLQKNISE